MAATRFLISFTLAGLLAATGCHAWCDRHYPCQAPVYAAPTTACVPCVPCCPSGTSYAPPPPAPPSANWTQPAVTRSPCYCP